MRAERGEWEQYIRAVDQTEARRFVEHIRKEAPNYDARVKPGTLVVEWRKVRYE